MAKAKTAKRPDVHDVYGVRDTVRTVRADRVGLEHALDQRADTVIGRLRILKVVTEEQYRAGVQMEALVQLYRMARGLGLDRVQAIDLRGQRGGGAPSRFTAEDVDTLTRRVDRMYHALGKAGHRGHRVTVATVMRGEAVTDETLHALQTGLSVLAKHFGSGRGAPNRVLVWRPGGKCQVDVSLWEKA